MTGFVTLFFDTPSGFSFLELLESIEECHDASALSDVSLDCSILFFFLLVRSRTSRRAMIL